MLNNNSTFHVATSQSIFGVIFVFLTIIGIVFNSAVLHVFRKTDILQTPTNVFIIGCVICDLLMVSLGFPCVTASLFHGEWMFGEALCEGYAFLMTFLGVTSIVLLAGIALDRYYVITQSPIALKITTFKVCMVILAYVVYGLLWATLPLFGFGRYVVERNMVSCGPDWTNTDTSSISYNISIIVLVYAIPLCVIIFCYTNIIIKVRRRISITQRSDSVDREWRAIERHVTSCVFITTLSFLLAWTPYTIVSIWSMFNDVSQMPEFIAVFAPMFAKSASVWNPLVYVTRNIVFRKSFYQLLLKPLVEFRQTSESRSNVQLQQNPLSNNTIDTINSEARTLNAIVLM